MESDVTWRVDGRERTATVDTRSTVLDALRDRLGVMAVKKGCDHGQCGSCTVLMDDRRQLSCLALAVAHDGEEIVTAAGLADGEVLHPVQEAFVAHDALQCGYCTPGQVCSAVGMLQEVAAGHPSAVTDPDATRIQLDDDEVRERMSGNLCRCGAYPHIVAAIREAASA